ncbi:hypothetical protein NBRC116492_05190 [Aurantivibrio infirmus]
MQDKRLKKLVLASFVIGIIGIIVAKYFLLTQSEEDCETKKIEVVTNGEAIEFLDEKTCVNEMLDN